MVVSTLFDGSIILAPIRIDIWVFGEVAYNTYNKGMPWYAHDNPVSDWAWGSLAWLASH